MIKICFYSARYVTETAEHLSLGIGYLISYLLKKQIIGENEFILVDNEKDAVASNPDVMAIGSVSQVVDVANAFAKTIKDSKSCVCVLGGYHITSSPHQLPSNFDIGILGEGEVTFAELIKALKKHRNRVHVDELKKIKSICYRYNTKIFVNPLREVIKNLDLLAFPYRNEKIFQKKNKEVSIITSRGCPYNCIFCASHGFWQNQYRVRSAESVISEIDYIVNKFKPDLVNILDDLWIADKNRFKNLVNRLVELEIPDKIQFIGFLRSNIVKEEDILLLKRMNYKRVRFGAETGSNEFLHYIKGKNISIQDHQRVIDLCEKHRIECSASFMFGVPGETIQDINKTIHFLRKNKGKLNIEGFYYFNPIPGTKIWKDLKKTNLITENFDFTGMRLDFLKNNFYFNKKFYFNEDNIPLAKFKKTIKKIKREFFHKKHSLRNRLYYILEFVLGEKIIKKLKVFYKKIIFNNEQN